MKNKNTIGFNKARGKVGVLNLHSKTGPLI